MPEWLVFWIVGSTIITTFIMVIFLEEAISMEDHPGVCFINPKIIYDNVKVNWFGCIVLTILAHIAVGPIYAAIYWFYKLCTVGRKW